MVGDNYIFVHIPKTGGRSVTLAMTGKVAKDHRTISDYCNQLTESVVRGRFKFTCIRNPWDRAVSWWAFFGNMGFDRVPFDQWLKKISATPRRSKNQRFPLDQMSFCKTNSGEVLMDAFIRFENMATDWISVSNKLGVTEALSRIGNEDRKHRIHLRRAMLRSQYPQIAPMVPTDDFRDMYSSQELVDIVAQLDSETIKRFGYTFK